MATERLQIPLDRCGRVVLPKAIRDHLGMVAGATFEVKETKNAILLRPIPRKAKIVNKNGWLVISSAGQPIRTETVRESIAASRRETRWR